MVQKPAASRGEQEGGEGDAMSVFDNIKHRVHEKFKTAAELVIPVRSTSGMQENNYACACQMMMMMMICLRACRGEWGGERGRESGGGEEPARVPSNEREWCFVCVYVCAECMRSIE